jgi:hypothetical protein
MMWPLKRPETVPLEMGLTTLSHYQGEPRTVVGVGLTLVHTPWYLNSPKRRPKGHCHSDNLREGGSRPEGHGIGQLEGRFVLSLDSSSHSLEVQVCWRGQWWYWVQ